MTYRSSFSQHDVFDKCKRWWYYLKVKEVPVISDFCYANAGSAVHKTLEKYYEKEITDMEAVKEFFNNQWNKYKLSESKIANKKDEYWIMILNGINLDEKFTSTELKIYYPDGLAYIDVVNSEEDKIGDWKSSTRREENEESYRKQILMYSWFYWRKFGRIPKESTVYYLKYNGSKCKMSFNFTEEDIKEIETWYNNILGEMNNIIETKKVPSKCEQCHMFCPYEDICIKEEDFVKFDIHIFGDTLQVFSPLNSMIHKALMKKFSYELKNAYFMKKSNPYARTTIEFWKPRKQLLPYGFLNGLKKTLQDYIDFKGIKGEINIIDHREFNKDVINMPNSFKNGIKLRDYQEDAVEAFLKNKLGILEVGTGGGKTEIAIETIRRLGVKTLFVVDKIELLKQTKERMEKALGIKVGQIGRGVYDIQQVTVATIQTLTKNIKEYADYLKSVRYAIFDETHKVAAKSYVKLGQYLPNTEYRLGISGTAFRDDGNDMMINSVVGYKLYDLSGKVLIEKGWLVKPVITFVKDYMTKEEIKDKEENIRVGLINETMNYNNSYKEFIVHNDKRNLIIQNLINKNNGKKILVLVKLIEHGELLEKAIDGSQYLHGSVNKKDRDEMFKQFTDGNLNIFISTISIFSEGIDVPSLDMVINAAANKGNVKTIQVLGRVLRKMEGKNNAHYIDFIDETKFFKLASYARKRALIKEGHEVETTDSQSLYNG